MEGERGVLVIVGLCVLAEDSLWNLKRTLVYTYGEAVGVLQHLFSEYLPPSGVFLVPTVFVPPSFGGEKTLRTDTTSGISPHE